MRAGAFWLFAAVALLLSCSFGIGGNLVGFLVLAIATASAVTYRELRLDGRLALAFVVIVVAHAAIAGVNGLAFTTPGADIDAVTFQTDAEAFAEAYAVDPDMAPNVSRYATLLGHVYHLAGTSLLLGGALSVLAFALGAGVLVKIMREIDLPRRAGTLLLFGIMPSSTMLLSVTLREAYQQLFLFIAVLAALRMRTRGWRWALPMLLSAGVLSASHNGLGLYAGFLIIVSFTWAANRGGRGRSWRQVMGLGFAAAIVIFAVSRAPDTSGTIAAVANGEAFEFADTYRMFGARAEGRTTYGLRLDPSSPLAFAASLPVVMIEYMFAPFPWQIGNMLDVDAFLESMIRLVLIIASVVAWRRSRGPARSQLTLLLWLYFGMELLWSLGTVNWGTAIRHHLPAFGLLAIAGGPLVIDTVAGMLARLMPVRRTA